MPDTIARKRGSSLALFLFLAVYVAALVVTLAPRGTFSTAAASLMASGD